MQTGPIESDCGSELTGAFPPAEVTALQTLIRLAADAVVE